MFEQGWTKSAEQRDFEEKALAVYEAWYNWIPAADLCGDCLDVPMRVLGVALRKQGLTVQEPYLDEEDTHD